ncbi:MAG: hypothetical protein ACKO6N_02875 [Myxococcota bacterium]
MSANILGNGFHLSLAIGQHLWTDLFSEALPVQVGKGHFDVNEQLRPYAALLGEQLGGQVKQLAARTPPLLAPPVEKIKNRYGARLEGLAQRLRTRTQDVVKLEGDWNIHITREGSRFTYSPGAVTVSARFKLVAEGTLNIDHGRFVFPFTVERFVRGSFTLGDLRFEKGKSGLVGTIRDIHLELGEHPVIKTAEVWVDRLVDAKVAAYKELTLLQIGQINKSLEEALGQLKFMAQIDSVNVEINDANLLLQVNFLFQQKLQATLERVGR